MYQFAPTAGSLTLKAWFTCLLFWVAVFAAAGMYALVALSPKLLAWHEEQERWRENQERLVRLERQVHHLKQVARVLESDPEFAAELARVELDASRPGDERLRVDGPLTLAADDRRSSLPTISAGPPWYEPILREFAEDVHRRRWTLFAAAGLVVFAFTFLQTSPARNSRCEESSSDRPWLKRRYGRNQRTP